LLVGIVSFAEEAQLRVAAYNVEVSRSATAQEIGLMLKAYDLGVVSFSEAPEGNWTQEVDAAMGLDNSRNELGIDVAKQNTHDALKPEGVRYLFIPLIESCAKFLHIES